MAFEYLKNGICNFKFIGRTKYSQNKVNIVSLCLFKISSSYKNFDIYVNGLSNWNNILKDLKSDFRVRLFIDINIYNDKRIYNKIESLEKIEPVLFLCSNYVIDKFHIDLFASLVRFFPLFNFKNNDSKSVLVGDLDIQFNTPEFEDEVTFHKYILKNYKNINNFCYSSLFYEIINRFNNPYIGGGMIYTKNRYNKNTILDFIQNVNNKKLYSRYYDYKPKKLDIFKLKNKYRDISKKFRYGVDEIFLNEYFLYREIKKYNVIFIHSNFILFKYLIGKRKLKILINQNNYNSIFEQSIYEITNQRISLYDYYYKKKHILDLDQEYKNYFCFNFNFKSCLNSKDQNMLNHNQELLQVINNFKNKIPTNTFLFKILNSGVLEIKKLGALINLEAEIKNKKISNIKIKVINSTKY